MTSPTPLTTIFSLPSALSASCLSHLYWDGTTAVVLGPGPQCLPPGPSPTSQSLSTYYSPGVLHPHATSSNGPSSPIATPACPENYTPACSTTQTIGPLTETAVTCCPANAVIGLSLLAFKCQPSASRSLTAMRWFAQYGCTMTMGDLASQVPLTVSDGVGQGVGPWSIANVQSTEGPNAYSVQVRWQATDLVGAVSTTTTGTASENGSSTRSTSTQPTSTSTSSGTGSSLVGVGGSSGSASSTGGLSTGAMAAIGVVVPVLVIGAIIAAVLMYRRRRKAGTKNESVQYGQIHHETDGPYYEMPVDSKQRHSIGKTAELGTERDTFRTGLQELPGVSEK